MRNLVAIPLLGLAVIIQSAIVGQITLLSGFADIVLVLLIAWALQEHVDTAFHWALLAGVMLGVVSRLPWFIYIIGYCGAVVLAHLLQGRVWQVPLLAMFSVTFFGTILLHGLSFAYLMLSGDVVSLPDALGLVTLPSVLLNMLVAIPLFGMMRDLAGWVNSSGENA